MLAIERADQIPGEMLARLARLTPRQKDCLRFVRPRYPSKMIARDLGVSPLRIDAHVGDAMVTLGLNSSFEAGRLLRFWEQTEPSTTLVSKWVSNQNLFPQPTIYASLRPLLMRRSHPVPKRPEL